MADVVNLNRYRKAKQRQLERRQAIVNCEKFGRSKAQSDRERRQQDQERHRLDAKKLDQDDDRS
jgi:Domain of unknown function (DUF4169)